MDQRCWQAAEDWAGKEVSCMWPRWAPLCWMSTPSGTVHPHSSPWLLNASVLCNINTNHNQASFPPPTTVRVFVLLSHTFVSQYWSISVFCRQSSLCSQCNNWLQHKKFHLKTNIVIIYMCLPHVFRNFTMDCFYSVFIFCSGWTVVVWIY